MMLHNVICWTFLNLLLTLMILPLRLLATELNRNDCLKTFFQYQNALEKVGNNSLRLKFIDNCIKSDVIPRFLKFRIPNNGCFDDNSVHSFQKGLLRKELLRAQDSLKLARSNLDTRRNAVKNNVPEHLLPSVALHSRIKCRTLRSIKSVQHNKKLLALSDEQEKPLFNVQNTVIAYNLDSSPPKYVMETLSLGPKNAVIEKFDPKDIYAELDILLNYCKSKNVDDQIISDINIRTLQYVRKCNKQKPSRNIHMTKRYLKEHDLLAIPFDKGVGICIMKRSDYETKLSTILELPQFEKVVDNRKNAVNPVIKEHDRIIDELKELNRSGKIDDDLLEKMRPTGSHPARLYGTGKVHKTTVPVRPILSMPGSAYHKIALQTTEWLSVVPECGINSSTKQISESLNAVTLDEDEEVVSFDVTSLYTNVPVQEAIEHCADLLYCGKHQLPPVDKDTFIRLLQLCACDVLMLTHDGFYKQVDGLAMGSPPAPLLANGWLSKYDPTIQGDAKLYYRYMDDIIRSIKRHEIDSILRAINELHPMLQFTIEREIDGRLAFLDMLIIRLNQKLSSTWYNKPTDTGLVMNYLALSPKKYKRSVVSGFVHRIFRACSTWENFHSSLSRAKRILERNQYPPQFYEPIIHQALEKLIVKSQQDNHQAAGENESQEKPDEVPKLMIFLQYRGKVTEDFCRALKKCSAPVNPVMTLRKLKTVMPSLKPRVEKKIRSDLVYKITCPRCQACYVGFTHQHLCSRYQDHRKPSKAVGKHLRACGTLNSVGVNDIEILAQSTRGTAYLMTLEALWQQELRPTINTKKEWKSRELTIKLC